MTPSPTYLFVYGTLRCGAGVPMAGMLARQARWLGTRTMRGHLYRIADYPGFIPDEDGEDVTGDLFALYDPETTLSALDDYEECSVRFPAPHEYRRVMLPVASVDGCVAAWTYVYTQPVHPDMLIAGGDFLADRPMTKGTEGEKT
ncbi:MAG: gamma-glutamylcyclotransferase [Sphingobium sp.]|nr:MAG: gamma-glutamylcyclotransferase [Sphingobium sp.]